MKKLISTFFVSFLFMSSFTQAAAEESGLLATLTDSLGVTEAQGSGGLGSLFGYVKDNVSVDDFSSLASNIPGLDGYLSAAPSVDESDEASAGGGGLGGLLEKAGEFSDTAKSASKLQKQFSELGLSTENIGQYANIAMDYFNGSGNSGVTDILSKALSSFL